MLKLSTFLSGGEEGLPTAIPLFGSADPFFEKTAAPHLLPEVAAYIAQLQPSKDAQYVLINALGASEYYGSNVNADAFTEECLNHKPDSWTGKPLYDRQVGKDWGYGFPTFYEAKPFLHHRNKDFAPHNHHAYGVVEMSAWNDVMKRVELVVRVDRDKCIAGGGTGIWDKLTAGHYPDTSMGCRVPWDRCSICTDMQLYRQALATFVPGKHRNPGQAVLAFHKNLIAKRGHGIQGISITRADYCQDMRESANKILPDGRKVWVFNDFPRFFDISFVFIGADKTSKVMMKIAGAGRKFVFFGSSNEAAEKIGYVEEVSVMLGEKTASAEEPLLDALFGKIAKEKKSEIIKRVPAAYAKKVLPSLVKKEAPLKTELLDFLGKQPLDKTLSTTGGLGVVLRPHEFQRIVLVRLGMKDQADSLEKKKVVFSASDKEEKPEMGPSSFSPVLAQIIASLLCGRSALGPSVEKRVLMISIPEEKEEITKASSLTSDLLDKIGSAYNGYRHSLMDFPTHFPSLLSSISDGGEMNKMAEAPGDLVTALSEEYLKNAFWEELPGSAKMQAWRGDPPSRTAR